MSTRRTFLKLSLLGSSLGYSAVANGSMLPMLRPTPAESEGPFYPVTPQRDTDSDLTRIDGQTGRATGEVILIEGIVLDETGTPIAGVEVDAWQANAAGRYRHPNDPSRAPLDPGFQGWAVLLSDEKGRFRIKTIMPGSYPASREWVRPPHIHYKFRGRGYRELTTQMYFPDHPLNRTDLLLMRKSKVDQQLMIAERLSSEPETFGYRIVLRQE